MQLKIQKLKTQNTTQNSFQNSKFKIRKLFSKLITKQIFSFQNLTHNSTLKSQL